MGAPTSVLVASISHRIPVLARVEAVVDAGQLEVPVARIGRPASGDQHFDANGGVPDIAPGDWVRMPYLLKPAG